MFLINSRFPHFSAATHNAHRTGRLPHMAPLLPKLRGHFAEFLNHSSPERLSILNQTTCVGFRYGPCTHIARGFSRQHRHIKHPQQSGYASRLTLYAERIYLSCGPHAYTTIHSVALTTNLCHPIAWLPTIKIPRTTHQTNTKSIDPAVVGG